MRAETREDLLRVAPLLAATLVACTAAATGMTSLLAEPSFEFVLHTMIVVSILAAAFLGRWSSFLGLGVIAIAIAALTQRLAPAPGVELVYPPEVVADQDLTWATLWAWLMVGFCFMIGKRRNVIFPLVAGLAIFGLIGTVNLNIVMLLSFAVFIFAVVFIWGYEHLLNMGESLPANGGDGVRWLGIARTQAVAGSLLVAVLLAVGIAIGSGLYLIGPRLFVGPEGLARYAQYFQRNLLTYGGVLDSLSVGRGPVMLSSAPAIRVQADRPALWRGAAYDFYTGTGWRRTLRETRPLIPEDDGWYRVPDTEDLEGTENRQLVSMDTMEGRAIYAAARPVRVRMTEEGFRRTRMRHDIEVDPYQTLRAEYMMAPDTQFEVISIMPPTDPETLRAAPTEYPRRIVELYIDQMQAQAELELSDVVAEVTEGALTPYDKAEALRSFLSTTCVYTTRAPAIPYGEDAAVYFVETGRRGACTLFATSMTVMCRLAGIPARVATGFQTGEYNPETGEFVPLQRDAHAWAELYFPGVGWVPFDIAAEEEEQGILEFLREGRWRRQLRDILTLVGNIVMVALIIGALVSAVLGPGVVLRWFRGRARRRTPRERLGLAYERFRRKAGRIARVRLERWRTPDEMRLALAEAGLAESDRMREGLDNFTRTFYDQRYGRGEPTDEEIARAAAEAKSLLADLRREVRRSRRRRRNGVKRS